MKKVFFLSVVVALIVSSCATTNQQSYQKGIEQGKQEVENQLSYMDIHKVYVPAQIVGGAYIPAHYTYKYEKTVVGVNGEGGLKPQTDNSTKNVVDLTNSTTPTTTNTIVASSNATQSVNVADNSTTPTTTNTIVASNSDNATQSVNATNSTASNLPPPPPNEKLVSVVNTPTPPPPPPNLDSMVSTLNTLIDNGDLSETKNMYDVLKKANLNTQITNKGKYYLAMAKYEALVEHNYKTAYDDFAQSYIDSANADINSKNDILSYMAMCAKAINNKKDEVNAYKYIGDNYLSANDKLEALKYYYKADLVDPENESINIKIANILKNMGQDELAKAFLMKAYLQKEHKDGK